MGRSSCQASKGQSYHFFWGQHPGKVSDWAKVLGQMVGGNENPERWLTTWRGPLDHLSTLGIMLLSSVLCFMHIFCPATIVAIVITDSYSTASRMLMVVKKEYSPQWVGRAGQIANLLLCKTGNLWFWLTPYHKERFHIHIVPSSTLLWVMLL